jgi:hypothetical protein
MNRIHLILAATLWSNTSLADHTDAFCAATDANSWDWLYEEDGSYTNVMGSWGVHRLDAINRFRYFTISYESYQKLQRRCDEKGMIAQPAMTRFSDWNIFKVQMPSGETIFSRGYYTVDTDVRL